VSHTAAKAVRVVALLAVLIAGIAWVVTDRVVTLHIDGVARTVHTHAPSVASMLRVAGIPVGEHDALTPDAETPLSRGAEVFLDRGRQFTVTLDGKKQKHWVTARTVADALRDLGIDRARMRLSASRSARLPLNGFAVQVNTEKSVVLKADKKVAPVTTYAATVDELLVERQVTLGEKDLTEPARDATLADGGTVTVRRITVKTATETVQVEPPVTKKTDGDLMLDQKKVLEEGRSGKVTRTVEYLYSDGVLAKTNILKTVTLVAPKPKVVVSGSKPYPADDTGLNWDALAQCESGGRPNAVSSGGTYHGLYQFNVEMWHRMGGIGLPSEATKREQTYRAIKLYKAAGRDQWPHCGVNL
jgi:uncharacterized protein YabE (DUF348 family)